MSNEQVVRGYLEAVASGDPEAVRPFLAGDVVMHVPGRHSLAGERRGPDAIVELLRAFMESSGGSVDPELHDLLVSDDHVVVLARRTLAGVEAPAAIVYHVRDDKVASIWVHELDPYAIDEALGG